MTIWPENVVKHTHSDIIHWHNFHKIDDIIKFNWAVKFDDPLQFYVIPELMILKLQEKMARVIKHNINQTKKWSRS